MNWTALYVVATILILPAIIYGIFTNSQINSVFDYYSKRFSQSGITGAELAKKLLTKAGATDVDIANINGRLTDCYDSRHKVVKLSNQTFGSTSIAALGVCAHEVGHAIQDHKQVLIYKIRQTLVPVFSFISKAYVPLIIVGALLSLSVFFEAIAFYFVIASVVSYGATLMFYLITFPVEIDASKRALALLKDNNILNSAELGGAKQVLSAAAKTYLSALLTSLVFFLRFLSFAMMMTRKD